MKQVIASIVGIFLVCSAWASVYIRVVLPSVAHHINYGPYLCFDQNSWQIIAQPQPSEFCLWDLIGPFPHSALIRAHAVLPAHMILTFDYNQQKDPKNLFLGDEDSLSNPTAWEYKKFFVESPYGFLVHHFSSETGEDDMYMFFGEIAGKDNFGVAHGNLIEEKFIKGIEFVIREE